MDEFDEILAVCTGDEGTELKILKASRNTALVAITKNKGSATASTEFKKADDVYQKTIARLQQKYRGRPEQPATERLTAKRHVFKYCIAAGCLLSEQKVRNDIASSKIKQSDDGTWLTSDIDAYIAGLPEKNRPGMATPAELAERDELERKILTVKLAMQEGVLRREEKKEAFEWVNREWLAGEFAGLIGELKDSVATHIIDGGDRVFSCGSVAETIEAVEELVMEAFNETVSAVRINMVRDATEPRA